MERTPDRVGVLVSRDLSRCLASAHVCLVPRIAFWCRAVFFSVHVRWFLPTYLVSHERRFRCCVGLLILGPVAPSEVVSLISLGEASVSTRYGCDFGAQEALSGNKSQGVSLICNIGACAACHGL